jgi:hypothetical protein
VVGVDRSDDSLTAGALGGAHWPQPLDDVRSAVVVLASVERACPFTRGGPVAGVRHLAG